MNSQKCNVFFRSLLIFSIIFIVCSCIKENRNNWIIKSPDGKIAVKLIFEEITGEVNYQATNIDQKISLLENSSLGFDLGNDQFNSKLEIVSVEDFIVNEDHYELLTGKKRNIISEFTQAKFNLKNPKGTEFALIFRVYNDGFAYRYELDDFHRQEATLTQDYSSFNLPDTGRGWLQPYDLVGKWTPAYERIYTDGSPIGSASPDSTNGWCFPMLFQVNKTWLLITEAGLDRNNCAMHIAKECINGNYRIEFPVYNEAFDVCGQKPEIQIPWKSTWRTVITGDLSVIFESTLVTDLSEPSRTEDLNWIKPGRAAWSWWSVSNSPQDYQYQKEYVDFASLMGWEYSLVDANWNYMKGGDIEELTEYAESKDVGLLLWYNSGGPHNIVEEEPRDKMHENDVRRKEFEWMRSIGIKGIKVDFFQSDKKCVINQYHDLLRDALEFELVVNFHGCTMPRGWQRTYPNLLTMEAVRGGEVYKFGSEFPDNAPLMNTVYPFTRNVVGSMDYTPVMFSDHTYPHKTTFAHELATSVVFESGITHFADDYKEYLKQPHYIKKFLQEIDVVWDESKLLYGYPGREICVARRNGEKWLIAGLNSLNEQKVFNIDLSFLPGGNYKAEIICDGIKDDQFKYRIETCTNETVLEIDALPFGGFTVEVKID